MPLFYRENENLATEHDMSSAPRTLAPGEAFYSGAYHGGDAQHSGALRRPQTVVHRDAAGNITNGANSITRSVSMVQHTLDAYSYHEEDMLEDFEAVDLDALLGKTILNEYSSTGYSVLPFENYAQNGGTYGAGYSIEHILKNNEHFYYSHKNGVINIQLRFTGFRSEFWRQVCCLSQIVLKAPDNVHDSHKQGMIFTSNDIFYVDRTEKFNYFTKKDYEDYMEKKKGRLGNDDPLAWFDMYGSNPVVIEGGDKLCKYVLIKLLRTTAEDQRMDLQYAGFIGYSGSRAFPGGSLC